MGLISLIRGSGMRQSILCISPAAIVSEGLFIVQSIFSYTWRLAIISTRSLIVGLSFN
jgi:hypothetical protein